MDTRTNIVLALASLLLVAGAADAQATPPTVREEADALVMANHALTVTFQGKGPDLHLAPTANATASFGYRFTKLVEYRDLDSSGAPSPNEVIAALDLAGATGWQVDLQQDDANASANLTLTAPVELAAGATSVVPSQVPSASPNVTIPDRTATVSLLFTLGSATSVKVDLVVSQWPALGAGDTRLALLMDATGEVAADQGFGNVTSNATSVGALAWSTNATGETAEGAPVDVPVSAKTIAAGEVATQLAFVYDAAGLAKLDHDASVGLAGTIGSAIDTTTGGAMESIKEVPGATLLAVLAVAAVAAIGLRRH